MNPRDAKIVRAYQDGQTLQQIGDQLGLTPERIRQIVSRNGVTSANGGRAVTKRRRDADVLARVQPLLDAGITISEIPGLPAIKALRGVRPTAASRFWRFVNKDAGPLGCWPYMRSRLLAGYGRHRFNGHDYGAHQVAWALTHGREPQGLVTHSCDNPPCCNPAHLSEGTYASNIDERQKRGRHHAPGAKGVSREALAADYVAGILVADIAKKHGISTVNVNYAVRKMGLPKRSPGSGNHKKVC